MSKKLVFGLLFFFGVGLAALLFMPLHFSTIDYKSFHVSWTQIFREHYKPQSIVALSDIIRERAAAELNQSELFLPHYYQYNQDEIALLQKYAVSCEEIIFLHHKKSPIEKTWQWHHLRCKNETPNLKFFKSPPFIHPSGQSFTKLALQEGILKLDGLEPTLTLEEYLKIFLHFKDISPIQISLLKDHANFVVTDNVVFLLQENDHASVSYEAFSIQDWNSFLSTAPFQFKISPTANTKCFDPNEQGCWVERVNRSAVAIKVLSVFAGSLLLFIAGLFIYYRQKNRRLRKLEDEKRKFALQMLTHELRTPATSLSLLVENVRQDFDSIGDPHKENFLKICDEVLRL